MYSLGSWRGRVLQSCVPPAVCPSRTFALARRRARCRPTATESPDDETRRSCAPATLANAAAGHANGERIPGGYNVYPQQGAAGLWTTPTDLARFMIDVQRSATGERPGLLSRASALAMTTAGLGDWAVGFGVRGAGADQAFHQGGANAGFRNWATMFTASGNGVIVMTNSDSGGALADAIMRAVATDYSWTAMATRPLRDVPVPRETLKS